MHQSTQSDSFQILKVLHPDSYQTEQVIYFLMPDLEFQQ